MLLLDAAVSIDPTNVISQYGPVGGLVAALVLVAKIAGDLVSRLLDTRFGKTEEPPPVLDVNALGEVLGRVLATAFAGGIKPVLEANTLILAKLPIIEERLARLTSDLRDLSDSHKEIAREQAEVRGREAASTRRV